MSATDDTAQDVTVVLVHGAFADSSSWNGVVELLQAKGVKVTAAVNPLRGIARPQICGIPGSCRCHAAPPCVVCLRRRRFGPSSALS